MSQKWYTKRRHRIKFTNLQKPISVYHDSEGEALTFRDECLTAIAALTKMVKSPKLKAKNLKARFSFEDWQYVEATKLKIPKVIFDMIEWQDPNRVIRNSYNPTIAELVETHLNAKVDEGLPVTRKDMAPFDYWMCKAKIRNTRCQDLTYTLCEEERKRLSKGFKGAGNSRSASTVNGTYSCLNVAWDRLMRTHPALFPHHIPKTLKYLKVKGVVHTPAYTEEQVLEIIEVCYKEDKIAREHVGAGRRTSFFYLGPLVALFSETGIRNSFLIGLRVDEVILNAVTPYIHKKMKRDRMVDVPLSDYAQEVIRKQLLEPDVIESGYVFPLRNRNGKVGPVSVWTNRFVKVLKRNNLIVTTKPVHSFRSYVATRLRDAGASVSDIADMLGIDEVSAKGYVTQTEAQLANLASLVKSRTHKRPRTESATVIQFPKSDPTL